MSIKSIQIAALGGALLASLALPAAAQTKHPEPGIFPEGFIQQLQTHKTMESMDGNKDQKVTKAEFMAMQEKMFGMMDRNSDGIIDKDEWMKRVFYSGG